MGYRSLGIHLNQLLGSLPPTGEVPHTCKIVYYFNPRFTLGHFFALGPLTSPNLNIAAIWVTDPWVSI